jgi:PhnB protein
VKDEKVQAMQRVHPYLLYNDVTAAAEFLTAAFGFRQVETPTAGGGHSSHSHIELELDTDFRVRMSSPDGEYRNPRSTGRVKSMIQIDVRDIEAHFTRAIEAGATVLTPLQRRPYGDHEYLVDDLEGQRWSFIQRIPEDSR